MGKPKKEIISIYHLKEHELITLIDKLLKHFRLEIELTSSFDPDIGKWGSETREIKIKQKEEYC